MALMASERLRDFSSVLLIFALSTAMLWPTLHGDWPIGHDHPVHLFRIWQLRESLGHHFTPWSWSHAWYAGYPQNAVYPIGADLFVLLIQMLSFGLLTLGRAYGVAFWVFYFLYGYATFYFVRHAVGSRAAGLLAAVFLLTDGGYPEIGGWFWVVDMGVWTAALGMVPALIGTVWMASLLEMPTPRKAAALAVCVALALLCHPLHLIYFLMAVPLLCTSRYLSYEQTPWRRSVLFLGLAFGCGVLIASVWWVPYAAVSPYLLHVGESGIPLTRIAGDLIGGTLFPRMHPLAAAFGLLGAIFLLRSRRTLPLFMSLMIFVCIAAASSTFAELLGPAFATWWEKSVIPRRFLMLLKPFWYGAAAFLMITCWRAVGQLSAHKDQVTASLGNKRQAWIRRSLFIVFAAAFVAPILFYYIQNFFEGEVRRPSIWHSMRKDLEARAEFVAWAKKELVQPGEFFRIAHGFDQDDHDLTDLGMELPCPLYKIYVMPTGHFKYDISSATNQALRAANVRFALSRRPLAARADLRLIKIFGGQLWLYEFRDWNRVPFEVKGGGAVQLLSFSDEDIVLRADESAHGILRVNVSYYPKWKATRDNVPVPVSIESLPGVEGSGFMVVPLAPGIYHFHYHRGTSGYVGMALCLLGITASVALARWDRLPGGLRSKTMPDAMPSNHRRV